MRIKYQTPLIYACSGCSFAGQTANKLAVEWNRKGIAEMSCLAGVAAGKSMFFKKMDGRKIYVVDGCPIGCASAIFREKGIKPDHSIYLHKYGVPKNKAVDIDLDNLTLQIKERTS